MINRYAAIALSWSSIFLIVMAVLVNSTALFYMAAAVIATLAASRIQAMLAVRYLRFERYTAPAVKVGEMVTVEIVVWSERQLKRPLVHVIDQLPKRLVTADMTPSLPVAPSFDQPIKTRYQFRPMRRGRYRWDKLVVAGTDALGLVATEKMYQTEAVELTVYPTPLPFNEDIKPRLGWGASDIESGRTRGAGLDPRGVREFASGDPLRYIHWRSSAKRGRLMVKEFETGSGLTIHFVLQRQEGTDIGDEQTSTFEAMCGHALFLAVDYAKKGATVLFPLQETPDAASGHAEARERAIREVLTDIQPTARESLAEDVAAAHRVARPGETVVAFVGVQDPLLPEVVSGWSDIQVSVLVYDPSEYGRLPPGQKPATDPRYVDALETAGAVVVTVPRVERIG
ncbi:MAG: DUF58 domain-containing protein [Fimbriimonadaceae bacterium]|nr:DUF58 domain-containing protein [Fimbriimonadaceae bacterium]